MPKLETVLKRAVSEVSTSLAKYPEEALLWPMLMWYESRGPVGVAGGKELLGIKVDPRCPAEIDNLLGSGGD